MAKKKTALSQTLFQDIDPYGQPDANEGAENIVPLTAIRPDPSQPRRLLPAALAQKVANGTLSPMEAMRAWVKEEGDGGAEMQELRRLADSIARHGLINAISVRQPHADEQAPPGVRYFVVTGERRYWAHVLLALEGRPIRAGETVREPTEIRVGLTAPGITVHAHQLIENIMREDINAVEKARGLWALRCELSGVNYSSPGHNPSEVNYRSLAEAAGQELVPWDRVSEEVGISKRYRIYLTSVLNLSEQAQALIEQHNLAEITVRPIVQKLRDDPELQVEALRQVVRWQHENAAEDGPARAITPSVQALVDELLARKRAQKGKSVRAVARAVDHAVHTRQFRKRVRQTLRFLADMPQENVTLLARDLALDKQFDGVVEELSDLHQQLETILEQIDAYRQANRA